MRDRASVNIVAIHIYTVFPAMVDIGCFLHTRDPVGEKFNTPILEEFVKVWINMFTRIPQNQTCMVNKGWVTCSYILGYSLVVKMGNDDSEAPS